MACLIIGIVWVCLRFIAQILNAIFGGGKKEWGCLSWLVFVIGWLGNIALLIIGACTV